MSSFMQAVPDVLAAVSADVAGIGEQVRSASALAAAPTSTIATAAGDEVSEAIARLFGVYAHDYQVLSARMTLFNE